MLNLHFDWVEVDALISLLDAQGVSYLLGNGSSVKQGDEDPVQLLQRLAGCGYPLVENAAISLFLLHPELAPAIVEALQHEQVADALAILTLAALYLQQWWIFRLTWALGHLPNFPSDPFVALWEERHLPSPNSGSGLEGLLALQAYKQRATGIPLNFLVDWQNQLDHLLRQEEAYQREISEATTAILYQLSISERVISMSMRQRVGRAEIEQFLVQVGRTREPGRLYLVGGAALVHRGIRPGQTLDIDIQLTLDPGNLSARIAQLKQQLNINIEFASPGDFIPLPSQWEDRSAFVKRYQQVEVFYFDWYSIALSKTQRASQQDLLDLQLLVRQGFVEVAELDRLSQDVTQKIATPAYIRRFPNLTPEQFSQRYQVVRQLL